MYKRQTQTFEGGDSAGDPALVRILADNALDAVHWMEDHGLIYEKEVFTAIGGLWQRGHAVEVERKGEQGGSYYVSCLMDAAQATGNFTLYTDAKIEELIAIPRGEELFLSLHPLFTTLHLQKRKQRRKTDRWIANQPELKGEEW